MAKKIELLHTTYDESGNIESQEVVHPLTSPDCIIMENGKTLDEVMGDGIATPTLTHEGTSFKVGVGDSNIEVVDGDVAGMTLKGQSYQNILPKPTTLIMETDEKEFKINDKIDSNIIIDDNIAEIATVKGKTIVNAVQEGSASEYTVLGEDLSGQSIVTTNKPKGNIKGVTLQGQTLVNTIQEPCKDSYVVLGADDGIEISAETGGCGTIEGTIGGSIKSAILKGNTLVNISENLQTITRSVSDWYAEEKLMDNIEKIKRSTYYTVLYRLEHLNGNHEHYEGNEIGIGINGFSKGLPNTISILDKNGGWCKIRFQLTDDFIEQNPNFKRLHIRPIRRGVAPVEGESVDYTIRGFAILEGDYITNPIPFNEVFGGMQSVQMPVVKTTGKNLISYTNDNKMVDTNQNPSDIIYENGGFKFNVSDSSWKSVWYDLNLKPNTTYTITYTTNFIGCFVFKSKVNTYVGTEMLASRGQYSNSEDSFVSPKLTFTTDSRGFVRIRFTNSMTNGHNIIKDIQIEEGSTKTSYEPYQSFTVTTSEEVELRRIDEVKDELDLTTGKLTQRIGETVLDGSEDWSVNNSDNEGFYSCSTTTYVGVPSGKVICEQLPSITSTKTEGVMIGITTGKLLVSFNRDKTGVTSLKTFKAKLAELQLKVCYELATPIIKTIDLQVTDQDGNTIPHIQTQPTVTHITASSDYLIPTVTIDNNLAYDTIIKPSTTYTVRFKRGNVNADNPLIVDLGGTTQTVTSTEFTITTPSELTHNQLVFSGKNNVVSEVQVIEGDVVGTQYPFFEGMNDVKFSDSKFIGRGKNLLHVGKGYSTTNNYNGLTVIRNEVDQTITVDGTCTLDNTSCALAPFYREFKKGERYAISCKLISGTADKILFRVNDEQWKGNISCGVKATGSNIYETCIKTFYSDETYNRSSIRVDSGATFNNAVFKVMLEKIPVSGDYTPQYEPYKGVEVQQDVDSIPLTSDMFEQGNIASGKIVGMSYQQLNHNTETVRVKSKTLIPIKPNGKYIIQSLNKTNNRLWGWQYDKNGGYLSSIGNTDEIDVFQFDSKAHYITFVLCNQDNSAISPSDLDSLNLILQEVPQEIVLRGIGDVKDELDLTRGEYIQRIGEIKLIDQKNIGSGSKTSEMWFEALIYLDDYIKVTNNGITKIISNKLPLIGDTSLATTSYLRNNAGAKDYIVVALAVEDMGGLTGYDGWHYYVKNNDVVIQYQLETPIIHKVNLTNTKVIPSYATETHYETITPSDSLIPNITIPSTLNYNVAIKPSTEYTIRANTSDNLTVDLGGATGTLSNGKVTLTTPATLTHNEVKFSGTGKVKELMVVEGNEIKDNVPFFNGMKDVQMGGIKLVNIARGAVVNSLVSSNANGTQYTYTSNGSTSWGDVAFDKALLKPNTVYTVYMNIVSNTSDNGIKIQLANGKNGVLNISKGTTGIIKQTIVSAQELVNSDKFALYFRNSSTSGQKVVIENPMIIEGDWTHLDEIPFIESEMIIEQPIIRSQGKNLLDLETKYFNPSNVTYTKSGTTYTVVGNTSNYNYGQFAWTTETSSWFRNLLGKEVTLSVSSISCTNTNSKACIQVRMECTDGSKVYHTISTNDDAKYETFTIPSNAIDMALQLMSNNTGSPLDGESTLTVSNIQLELGSTATSYEPFKHQTLYSNRVIGYEDGCYYAWDTGIKTSTESITSVMSDVEGLNVAYVTHASSNFSFYDKDGAYLSGSMFLSTATDFDRFGFIKIPANAKYMKMACGNKNSAVAKDYHLKATVTGELPLRSLPNGVCDTLNLVTGEYVQRVGEVVLDGSEGWRVGQAEIGEMAYFMTDNYYPQGIKLNTTTLKLTTQAYGYPNVAFTDVWHERQEGLSSSNGTPGIRAVSNTYSTVKEWKAFLQSNPITVQYELETPIVRKLGFTTKGNYRQANLATDCEWGASPTTANNTFTTRYRTKNASSLPIVYNTHLFTDDFDVRHFNIEAHGDYEYISNMEYGQYVNVRRDKLEADTVEAFSKWIQQNPIEIGCITWKQSSESYSNIHKPIFFNDVNVQFLPHNVDIQPQLTLQARTRNSYVMDMMKANTKYTIKLLNFSGNMKIDGTSYTLANNRTFISPSTLTNKELIISGQWYEPMIIEGDVTGKNLPYFKGILSSYHDVDEIEVYSVTKNIFDGNIEYGAISTAGIKVDHTALNRHRSVNYMEVRPNTTYTYSCSVGETSCNWAWYDKDKKLIARPYSNTATSPSNAKYLLYFSGIEEGTALEDIKVQIEEGNKVTSYIPHTHNTTLIEMPTRLETVKVVRPVMEKGSVLKSGGTLVEDDTMRRPKDFIPVQPNTNLTFMNGNAYRAENVMFYNIDKNYMGWLYTDGSGDLVVPDNCYFIKFYSGNTNTNDLVLIKKQDKPIALNELPNGVKDELIINRATSSAKLIRRVGKVVLDGSETWYRNPDPSKESNGIAFRFHLGRGSYLPNSKNQVSTFDNILSIPYGIGNPLRTNHIVETNNEVYLYTYHAESSLMLKQYLQQNPITVYYELATPIIHEIQLKGYPHVYENGTVTLNTDTPHQTLVSYNVNQEQLINTQNETIIRHDQQIDDLYYYIEIYLEEIYQTELFRMKLELSL